jgi:hypothetical protein
MPHHLALDHAVRGRNDQTNAGRHSTLLEVSIVAPSAAEQSGLYARGGKAKQR